MTTNAPSATPGEGARILALAGLASPLVLAIATIAIAAGRPDYSHLRNTISELGAVGRPGAVLMRFAGNATAGALAALAAVPLSRSLGPGGFARAGAVALALAGAAIVGTAIFPWTGAANDLSSASSKLHLVFALAGFLLLALNPLLFGLQLRRTPDSRGLFMFSMACAALTFVFAFLLAWPPYLGATQRAALVSFYLWLVVVSWRAWRSSASA
jgi:hypothetical membrane protein